MIELKNVSKRYGNTVALDRVNINIAPGKITGLFGPNGAGKSTTLKLVMGLNRPDSGEVNIDGLKPAECKHRMAFLPEIDHLYGWMTIAQAARFMQAFYGDWDNHKYKELLQFLRLDEEMKIGRISKGQRTKTKLLLTASRQADYLFMDEPLSGIDILTRDEIIRTLVKDYRAGEQTIIISTHEIAEVENLVEEVVFLDHGQVRLQGVADELREQKGMSLLEIMKEAFRYAN